MNVLASLFWILLSWTPWNAYVFRRNRSRDKRDASRGNSANAVLPIVVSRRGPEDGRRSRWNLSGNYFYASLATTKYNDKFRRVSSDSVLISNFYICGALFGMLSQLVSLAYLCYLAWIAVADLGTTSRAHAVQRLARRSQTFTANVEVHSEFGLQILLPGEIKLVPSFVLAILCASFFHELGHAYCGAAEDCDISSVGVAIVFAFPAAFVALSDDLLSDLPSLSRLKIWAAGVWHNAVLVIVTSLVLSKSLGILHTFECYTLWENVGHLGVSVVSMNSDSSLNGILQVGDVIEKLDDVELHDSDTVAHWDNYLREPPSDRPTYSNMGWCAEKSWFDQLPTTCCNSAKHMSRQDSCFVVVSKPSVKRCLSQSDITKLGDGIERCLESCSNGNACIWPIPSQPIVRVGFIRPSEQIRGYTFSRSLTFSGPKSALDAQLRTATLLPRFFFIPNHIYLEAFLEYVRSISVALIFFNSLPLPMLDGTAISKSALEWLQKSRYHTVARFVNRSTFAGVSVSALEKMTAVLTVIVITKTLLSP